jgi:hypothetical protein
MKIQKSDYISSLLRRVCGEFLEMPGMRLTAGQARRLWGLDDETCRYVLEFLVDAGFLCRRPDGMYVRLTEGHTECPIPATAG